MIYVLAREIDGADVYFVRANAHGRARWSPFWSEAAHFSTARAAYECAQTHRGLCNSDEWRVVAITPRCERTEA